MKKCMVTQLMGLVIVAAMFLLGCTTTTTGGTEADQEAIREIWRSYSAARIGADPELWLSLWDEEGI